MRIRDAVVAAAWLAAVVLTLVAVALLEATWSVTIPGDSWGIRGFLIFLAPVSATVGAVVATRVPANPIGPLLLATGLLAGIQSAAEQYAVQGILAVPGSLPAPEVAAWLAGWVWLPAMGCLAAFLPLLFPTGTLRSRRWRAVAWIDVGVVLIGALGAAFLPGPLDNSRYVDNPFALPLGAMSVNERSVVFYPFVFAVGASIAPLVLRFRESGGETRQQIKWLAWSAIVLGLAFVLVPLGQVGILGAAASKAVEDMIVVGVVAIPVSAGLAILRYRLWDIDRIVSRTVSYVILSAVLVGVYAAGVLAVHALVAPVADQNGPIAVAASTLIAASLFQPLRRRIQTVVDRRFNRARYDAHRTAEAFGERIRDDVDIDQLVDEVERAVDHALEPARLGLWLREPPHGAAHAS
ncbi:MAG TPA: hypothetical protein VGK63_07410 [Candidatus Limnocylindrales bacterium]